jgi:hypothetical protein
MYIRNNSFSDFKTNNIKNLRNNMTKEKSKKKENHKNIKITQNEKEDSFGHMSVEEEEEYITTKKDLNPQFNQQLKVQRSVMGFINKNNIIESDSDLSMNDSYEDDYDKNFENLKQTNFENREIKTNISINNEENNNLCLDKNGYLPCREKEQEEIYYYLKNGLLQDGGYQSLYIAGMPGTGKTACVKNIINKLENEIKNRKAIVTRNQREGQGSMSFQSIYLCGMNYVNPSFIFREIYHRIFDYTQNYEAKKCIGYLNSFFMNRKNIDKVYYLATGKRNSAKMKKICYHQERIQRDLILTLINDMEKYFLFN